MSTRWLSRAVLMLVVATGVVCLSGASAFGFFGHPLLSQITQAPEGSPLLRPSGLTLDSSGNLFLADAELGQVDVFDSTNAFRGAMGAGILSGRRYGVSEPAGVAVDEATGDVYVADSGPKAVFVFKPTGGGEYALLSTWSGKNSKQGNFGGGYVSVAIDNSTSISDHHAGDVYVLTTQAGIDVFKPKPPGAEEALEGEFLSELNTTGFSLPTGGVGATVDASTGTLYVPDNADKTVDMFNDEGVFTAALKGPASFEAGGVAVEESTHTVYVLDRANKNIDEFDNTGKLVEEIAEPLIEPLGIAVNPNGDLYVSDGGSEPHAVDIFGPAGLLPDLTSAPASEIKRASAKLEGAINPDSVQVTSCQFEYGPSTSYGHGAPCSPAAPGAGSTPIPVSAEISGLQPKTTYHYRITATNANGLIHGPDATFTTEPNPPVLTQQLPVESITRTTATVSVKLNPEGNSTTYRVLYGVSSGYGQHTAEIGAGSGSIEETVSAGLTGLTPATTYHYQFVATNHEGIVAGPEETFTTSPPTPPTAITGGASNVTLTTATVTGSIGSEGLETSYELDLGTDTTYGTSIYGEAGSSTGSINIEIVLQNLAPNTTYHYRIDAINSDGRANGNDQTLTTPPYDKPLVLPSVPPLLQTPPIAFPTETSKPTIKKAINKKARKRKGSAKRKKTKHKRRNK